jgi:dienelactone hydrolase
MNLLNIRIIGCTILITLLGCDTSTTVPETANNPPTVTHETLNNSQVNIASLSQLSIESLKKRPYESSFTSIKELHSITTDNEYTGHFFKNSSPYYSAILGYESDGLSLYSRIDIPSTPAPKNGFPVVVFIHGWVGLAKAKGYDFSYNTKSNYADVIHQFVQAGFVVLTPGLRGHGTVNGIIADGTEFIETWDNGSYSSPLFYSIDILNLLAGIESIKSMSWFSNSPSQPQLAVNTNNVNIFGHSQGGDIVLTALAVAGENATLKQQLNAGAIWAGCFLPRTEQLSLYGPMGSSIQAFLSGDGTWTASAIGKNGEINHNFLYPYPADWIGTPDNSQDNWTWQKDSWSTPTVKAAVDTKLQQMYQTFNRHVDDIENANYHIEDNEGKGINIVHDTKVLAYLSGMDAFKYPQYFSEKLALHHSDRDYYSPSLWNEKLSQQINQNGGSVVDYEYTGNTHSMKVSPHTWFSPEGTTSGFNQMMKRNISLFSN